MARKIIRPGFQKPNKDYSMLTEEEIANKRKGRQQGRLVSGPWVRKYYSIDLELFDRSGDKFVKLPNQVKGMLRYMKDHVEEIDAEGGLQGKVIAEQAIAKGYIASKIKPAALFAYYRKMMEAFGLILTEQG